MPLDGNFKLHFRRIAILGTGLIGASIGLAVREKRLAKEVVGVCRTERSVAVAKKIGAIDWGTTSPLRAVAGADLVILAAPIHAIPFLVRQMARHLDPDCLVTDVASVKGKLVSQIEALLPATISYIGSHPMAGRERTGPAAAVATLFEDRPCFVTPTSRTSSRAFKTICHFWRKLGARVKIIEPREHDHLVASLSHLPHLLAALLVLQAEGLSEAGTGFVDVTRIASSDPELWQDILLSNRSEVLKSLRRFRTELDRIASLLQKKNAKALFNRLQKAKRLRDQYIQ